MLLFQGERGRGPQKKIWPKAPTRSGRPCGFDSHRGQYSQVLFSLPRQFLTDGLGRSGIQKKQHRYKNENPLNLNMKAEKK